MQLFQNLFKIMSNKRQLSDGKTPATKKANFGAWNLVLKEYLRDPESAEFFDDSVIIIKDKFPKAKYHFLVMPRESIPNLKSLTKHHIALLKHMECKGQEIAERSSKANGKEKVNFRYGYHAVPSLSHLHLHVISQDFDSPCLKTKKHWNSFTTKYFVDSAVVLKQLEENGKFVEISAADSKKLLDSPLRCHRCPEEFTHMPKLKQHIIRHI